MAIQLNAQRIRFACDASRPIQNTVNDALTGAPIALVSGSALQIETIFYFGAGQPLADANLLDLSVFASINVQLQANLDPHSGTVYYAGNVAAANFLTPTAAQWTAAAAAPNAQLTLFIPSAANIVPPSAENFWLCIYGVSTDGAGDLVLLFAANIAGQDSGVPQGVAPLALPFKVGTKLSFVCADGLTRDLTLGAGPGGVWVSQVNQAGYNGVGQAQFSLYCADASWRDLSLQLQDGSWVLAINQNGHS